MNADDLKRDRLPGLVELNHDEVEQVEGGFCVRPVAETVFMVGFLTGMVMLDALGRVTGQS